MNKILTSKLQEGAIWKILLQSSVHLYCNGNNKYYFGLYDAIVLNLFLPSVIPMDIIKCLLWRKVIKLESGCEGGICHAITVLKLLTREIMWGKVQFQIPRVDFFPGSPAVWKVLCRLAIIVRVIMPSVFGVTHCLLQWNTVHWNFNL